jgi:NAD(P)-dependent dehydrogenase (short-subunit alcohol dehydrogenase family)
LPNGFATDGTRIEAAVVDADDVRLAVAKVAARLGPVDILVNNAGVPEIRASNKRRPVVSVKTSMPT